MKMAPSEKRVIDIPDNKRSRFFKIKYVRRKIDMVNSHDSPSLSVSQQADEKKNLLSTMTPAQRMEWDEGTRVGTPSCQPIRKPAVAPALENQINTHWAFGTTGLPSWVTTDERTINSIFKVRSYAAREVMEIASEHLKEERI